MTDHNFEDRALQILNLVAYYYLHNSLLFIFRTSNPLQKKKIKNIFFEKKKIKKSPRMKRKISHLKKKGII